MSTHRVISSDSHVFEPTDLFVTRMEPRFRDQAPHVVRTEDGDDWWICEGYKLVDAGAGGAQTGRRFEDPEGMTHGDIMENVRPGGYVPEEHVKDMDIDGIDVSIIYPTSVVNTFIVPDSALVTDIFRTYNDWVAEFCQPFPKRLKPIAMINLDDVAVGIAEMNRCAKMGFAGAMISIYPPEGKGYYSPEYEPFWAAAENLEMPLGLHLGTNRPGVAEEAQHLKGGESVALVRPSVMLNADHWPRLSIADMIFAGVFERYPKLQVGSVEMELAWVPHFLERMDYTYTQRAQIGSWYRSKEDMLPSDYFHRNVFLSFQDDPLGIKMREIIGVDNLLWGSDYPHQESTFPRSQQILGEILSDCTEGEKAKIVGANAARIYHLD